MGNHISRRRKTKSSSRDDSSTLDDQATKSAHDGTLSTYSQPKFTTRPPMTTFPHNEAEGARHQNSHYLLKHIFQSSYFAPVQERLQEPGATALDVGCGTNAPWIVELAMEFPNAEFHGIDIVDPFDDEASSVCIPKNIQFVRTSFLEGLQYENDYFDFVHQRLMYGVYHGDDINWVLRELKRLTKPDGWVELVEADMVPKRAGPLFSQLLETVHRAMRARQKHFFHGPRVRRFLSENGFLDVKTDYGSIPVCWGGYVGKLMYENMLVILRHFGPLIYHELDLTGDFREAHYDAFIDKAFDECVEYQTFFNVHWACGRKPAAS